MAEEGPSTSQQHHQLIPPFQQPLQALHALVQQHGAPLLHQAQQAHQHIHRHCQALQTRLNNSLLHHTSSLHRQALSSSALQGPWHPMLASISFGAGRGSSGRGSCNALCDVAMAKDEVKARLAPIPVYTVANPKNEFVLVAGEVGLRA